MKSALLIVFNILALVLCKKKGDKQQTGQWEQNGWQWTGWEWVPANGPSTAFTPPDNTGNTNSVVEPTEARTQSPLQPVVLPQQTVTEPQQTVTQPQQTVTQPQQTITGPQQTVTQPQQQTNQGSSSSSTASTTTTATTTTGPSNGSNSNVASPNGNDAVQNPGFTGTDNTSSGGASSGSFIGLGIGAAVIIAIMVMSVYYKHHKLRQQEEAEKVDDLTRVSSISTAYRRQLSTPEVQAASMPRVKFYTAPPRALTECTFDARSSAGSVAEPTEAFQDFMENDTVALDILPERELSSGSVNNDDVRESAIITEEQKDNPWSRAASEAQEPEIFTESKWNVASPSTTMQSEIPVDWDNQSPGRDSEHIQGWTEPVVQEQEQTEDVEDVESDQVSFDTAARYSTTRKSDESDYLPSGRSRGQSVAIASRASYTAADIIALAKSRSRRDSDEYSM